TLEDQEKIFDILRRAGNNSVAGQGMGLAYVRTLLRRHGGHIVCDSEPGVGTTFTFTLPVRPAAMVSGVEYGEES
ncbi:MAG TPA: HAMP domain-containing sensor histidine kinase, partial [Geobacterales bacterium]|nr:HAMP domain-containing sensor histidine kinase [Geobacterales bacterium]